MPPSRRRDKSHQLLKDLLVKKVGNLFLSAQSGAPPREVQGLDRGLDKKSVESPETLANLADIETSSWPLRQPST